VPGTGSLLAGRYRLEEVIGRGGMSTVYRATDETLGRTVAVKLLLATLAEQDPSYSVRFEREARAAAALANSSVVTVYDTGVDDGSHYIVMEYIEGWSLEQMLREGHRFQTSEALRIAAHVADALAAAHAAGILHRDIKPANVMVTPTGQVKVLDFGIARRLDGTTITQVASVVGTAAYMAPERALGQPGDARADVYSLGCLLYAMLTGAPPFSGELSAAILHQQINAEPHSPSAARDRLDPAPDGISPALDALVLEMLSKSPEERPATAAEVRERIARLPEAGGIAVPVATPGALTEATTPMTAATTPLASAGAPARPRRGALTDHRRRAVVMAIATALITLIAVALLSSGGTTSKQSTGARSTPTTTPRATTSVPRTTTASHTPTTAPPAPKPPKPKPKPTGPAAKPTGPAGPTTPPGPGGQPPGQAKKPGGGGNGGGPGGG
jgi:eukaryotic-like serine/threonine-protein kinase